jgi:hypothetical protein
VIVQHPQCAGCDRWQRCVPGVTGGATPIPSDVGALRRISQQITTLVVLGHMETAHGFRIHDTIRLCVNHRT